MIIAVNFPIGKKKPEKKSEKFTAMIILYFHLQPQFKYELFHILHMQIITILCLTLQQTIEYRGKLMYYEFRIPRKMKTK